VQKANLAPTTLKTSLGFIGAALTILMIFSDIAKSVGAWYPPYLGFSAIAGGVCMIGLWMMKKWGIIGYTALVAINQVVLIAMGVWNLFALIIPGIVIAIGFSKFKEME
jgi:hypothetical protein